MKGEDEQMFSKAQQRKRNLLMEENICFTRGILSVQTTYFFFTFCE